MNYQFSGIAYLPRKRSDGFTLIELLVVVVIIGVLAAISTPQLLKQVMKGRQAEAITTLGVVNRAQQAYRIENATFGLLSNLPLKMSDGRNYTFSDDLGSSPTATPLGSAQRATALAVYTNDIRDYASAVGQTAGGVFEGVVCPAISPNDDSIATTNNAGDVNCSNGVLPLGTP